MRSFRYIARLIFGFVILVGPAVPMLAQDAGKTPAAAAATAEKSAATFKRVSDQARQYLVTLATRWQKNEGEYPTGASEDQYHGSMRDQAENRKADEAVGVMLDPVKGLIIAEDHGQQPRFIESEKAFTADGKPFALKRHALYLDMDAALYQTDQWPGLRTPLAWLKGPLDLHGGTWTSASVSREAGFWRVTFAGGCGAKTMFRRTDPPVTDEVIAEAAAALVFDAEGRPIGFSPGGRISLTGDRYPWRGTAYSAMRVMTWTEFGALRADIERRVAAYAHEVRIVYRQPEQGEEDLEFDDEEGEEGLTRYYYGYAISPTRVLVAVKLEKEFIQRFETITVRLGDKDAPATFLGAYQHFGGFLVEMTDATSPGVLKADDAAAVPDFNRAVLTYVHERKFGQRRNTVWYNRVSSYDRGYEDRLWPTLKRRAEAGTLVLNTAGKPVGLCLVERFLDKEKRGEDNGWYYDDADAVRLYPLSKLAAALAKPSDHFDANLRPATGQQGHRLVWLGVETQLLDSRLAEMLDRIAGGDAVQQATRSGEIGLRITYLHKNSPAAKASLAEGDILLSITEDGKTKPIELTGEGSGGYWWGGYAPRSATGTQFGRRNNLTKLLTRLGPGTKVELRYLSGDEVKTQAFVLQWSPPDYESADKYKDEKTGVTVKDLTYDIRAMLKLDGDQPGVIVAKVEPGEKAALARIGGGVIITNINGESLKSIKDYERLIKGVQGNTDGGTAVLSLWSMGKSRRVKIEFP
jgi:hypothetical protein